MRDVRTIRYDYASYQTYDMARGADEVKKASEMRRFHSLVEGWQIHKGRALDVGCATGRYPLYLVTHGFEAMGIDVSEDAIRFCDEQAQQSTERSHVSFEVRDILTAELPGSEYTLITSMMGTINHLPIRFHDDILSKLIRSLTVGGRLVLSCWNPESPYLDFLSFYDAQERDILLANCVSMSDMKDSLVRAGFTDVGCHPFCFLPDACYTCWGEHISASDIVDIDVQIAREQLGRVAQMFLICGRKPLARSDLLSGL